MLLALAAAEHKRIHKNRPGRLQGKYAEAEPLYIRSVSIKEEIFGPDHHEVSTVLCNLAGLFTAQVRVARFPLCDRMSVLIIGFFISIHICLKPCRVRQGICSKILLLVESNLSWVAKRAHWHPHVTHPQRGVKAIYQDAICSPPCGSVPSSTTPRGHEPIKTKMPQICS